MELEETRRRDAILRGYFSGRDWDAVGEYGLKRTLVLQRLLGAYPYVIDDEWEVVPGHTNHGRGDLVFTDGEGRFAVVEVKYIDLESIHRHGPTKRTSNRKKRRKVEDQAREYAAQLIPRLPAGAEVTAFIFTNEDPAPQPLGTIHIDEE